MSIIMPGKMPDRCTSCVFCDDYFDDGDFGLCCSISGSRIYGRERLKDCPVIELPPHGRLIDADALNDLLINLSDNEYTPKVFASWLSYEENAPTILPAEPEKEDESWN